jgi:dTMP kinase
MKRFERFRERWDIFINLSRYAAPCSGWEVPVWTGPGLFGYIIGMPLKDFYALEGIDGSGTTTQLEAVSAALSEAGFSVYPTCEPTGGAIGGLIRRALSGELAFSQETLALLFAADRNEHLNSEGGLIQRLAAGQIVLSDRYLFSSLAYQSLTGKPALPFSLNAAYPLPEILFFLDIEPDQAMARMAGRSGRDIFETPSMLQRVAASYRAVLELYSGSGMRIRRLDAARPAADITHDIVSDIIGDRR